MLPSVLEIGLYLFPSSFFFFEIKPVSQSEDVVPASSLAGYSDLSATQYMPYEGLLRIRSLSGLNNSILYSGLRDLSQNVFGICSSSGGFHESGYLELT